ncbi:MAG: phosphoesterase, partial [Bacteroidota bacterium]
MKLAQSFYLLILFFLLLGCNKENDPDPITPDPTIITEPISSDAALKWGELTLKTMTKLPRNTPTYGSRALGYMGLTMYETVVNGSAKHVSMSTQLKDLPILPKPQRGVVTNYIIALNAGQAFMLKKLFDFGIQSRLNSIDSLEAVILNDNKSNLSQEVIDRSINYGKSVAEAIFDWSKTDGGYQGFQNNFDPKYIFPTGNGKWVPPLAGQVVSSYPLHPYWGQNRTFATANSEIPVPALIPYSQLVGSEYFEMFNEVYKKNINLTQTEKEIAAWWGDDPTETFTPPGHSYSIANQVVKKD